MTIRRLLLPLLAATALAGCGGQTVTTTVAGPTVTESTTATVTEPPADTRDAYRVAEDACRAYGSLARSLGGGDDEAIADDFARKVDPDLRAQARAGCLAGLRG